MYPIQIELSPGNEVRRESVLDAHEDQRECLLRASRDEYYCRIDTRHTIHKDAPHPEDPACSSAETMLEVELNAILRGEKVTRQHSAHRATVAATEARCTPPLPPPPPLTILTSQCVPSKQVKGGDDCIVINVPDLSRSPTSPSEVDICSRSRGSGNNVRGGNRQYTRRSAIRQSIDRFFSASEERSDEEVDAMAGVVEDSVLDHFSRRASTSPRASPQERAAGRAVRCRAATNALLVVPRGSNGVIQKSPLSISPKTKRALRLTDSPDGGADRSSNSGDRKVLQSLPVNVVTAKPTPVTTTKNARLPSFKAGSAVPSCSDDINREQQLMSGAEVAVTCHACHMSLKLFVFYPAKTILSVSFCPLCGDSIARTDT